MKHLNIVLEYVRQHEEEDFKENPSENHVYYSLIAYEQGELAAQEFLKTVLKEWND